MKTDVLDKCSEYGEYSAICDYNIINHGNRCCNCNVILLFILIFAINISLQFWNDFMFFVKSCYVSALELVKPTC